MLIGEPSEATKLVKETDDVIEKLFNSISLEIFSKRYGITGTKLFEEVLSPGFYDWKFHFIAIPEHCRLASHHFLYWLEISANKIEQLMTCRKVLVSCKRGSGKVGSYHQYTLITGVLFETFIPLDELTAQYCNQLPLEQDSISFSG